MTRALVVLGILFVCVACTPSIPDGVFECATDEDCPPDLRCEVPLARCYAPDGG